MMKSTCYVVLPPELSLDYNSVSRFVNTQIGKYHIEYEVEPYQRFFSEVETRVLAERRGYVSVADWKAALAIEHDHEGIENNQYYWVTTQNPDGYWDYFILEEIKPCQALIYDRVPYAVVDAKGVWHSERQRGYKPLLDFKGRYQHPDNSKVEYEWTEFLNTVFFPCFIACQIAILTVHS